MGQGSIAEIPGSPLSGPVGAIVPAWVIPGALAVAIAPVLPVGEHSPQAALQIASASAPAFLAPLVASIVPALGLDGLTPAVVLSEE